VLKVAKVPKIIDDIPVKNGTIITAGSLIAGLSAFVAWWANNGGPMPVMENSETITVIEEKLDMVDDDAIDQYSRNIRQDKRELWEVEQRLEEASDTDKKSALHEQSLILQEAIEEMEDKKARRRKKQDG